MKHVSDMTRDVFELLSIPLVTSEISGEVWEDVMHKDAGSKTNIVVKGIALSNTAIQRGITYINIHAPNLTIDNDPNFPNKPELYRVRDLVFPLVDTVYQNSFNVLVEEADEILPDKDGGWYLSIVLRYQSFQGDYKNI